MRKEKKEQIRKMGEYVGLVGEMVRTVAPDLVDYAITMVKDQQRIDKENRSSLKGERFYKVPFPGYSRSGYELGFVIEHAEVLGGYRLSLLVDIDEEYGGGDCKQMLFALPLQEMEQKLTEERTDTINYVIRNAPKMQEILQRMSERDC